MKYLVVVNAKGTVVSAAVSAGKDYDSDELARREPPSSRSKIDAFGPEPEEGQTLVEVSVPDSTPTSPRQLIAVLQEAVARRKPSGRATKKAVRRRR